MEYRDWMEDLARVVETIGVAIIAIGLVYAMFAAFMHRQERTSLFALARRNFGQPLILGLEVLVAADIIETVIVERTLESAASLGIIVLVRVVLSFSLDIEVDGMLPWRRAEHETARPAGED